MVHVADKPVDSHGLVQKSFRVKVTFLEDIIATENEMIDGKPKKVWPEEGGKRFVRAHHLKGTLVRAIPPILRSRGEKDERIIAHTKRLVDELVFITPSKLFVEPLSTDAEVLSENSSFMFRLVCLSAELTQYVREWLVDGGRYGLFQPARTAGGVGRFEAVINEEC